MASARLRIAASKRALDVESFIACPPSAPLRPGHRARLNTTRAARPPDDGDEQRVHERMWSDPAGTGISPGVPGTAVPATGEPDSARRTPAPGACTPVEAPIWFTNSRNTKL